jgi:hypothetical protein
MRAGRTWLTYTKDQGWILWKVKPNYESGSIIKPGWYLPGGDIGVGRLHHYRQTNPRGWVKPKKACCYEVVLKQAHHE